MARHLAATMDDIHKWLTAWTNMNGRMNLVKLLLHCDHEIVFATAAFINATAQFLLSICSLMQFIVAHAIVDLLNNFGTMVQCG